jgi:RNA polymerase sigma-70 factor (ECF subfamily)
VQIGDALPFENRLGWAGLNELSDADLLARLIDGEHSALAVLFDRYHRLVFSVAVRILRDQGEAEDVVQIVFLNIFESAINFDPRKGIFRVWLLQYAYHRALNRKRSLSAQRVNLWDDLDLAKKRSQQFDAESLRYCEQLLKELKPPQQQVLKLTYFEGWAAQEIADLQGRAVAHVRNDLYRSLARLRLLVMQPAGPQKRELAKALEGGSQIADTRAF